jgi:hypothetical protein
MIKIRVDYLCSCKDRKIPIEKIDFKNEYEKKHYLTIMNYSQEEQNEKYKRLKYLYFSSINKVPFEKIDFINEDEKLSYIKQFNEMRRIEETTNIVVWDTSGFYD